MRLSELSLELETVFKEEKGDLIIIFLFYKAARRFKNHLRMYRKKLELGSCTRFLAP